MSPPDRLRLILLYLLYRNGLLPADAQKLLAHARLPQQNGEVVQNLEILGARVNKPPKDSTPAPPPLFQKPVQRPSTSGEEYALSRFSPALKSMLEEFITGTLDQTTFPYTKPQLDANPNGHAVMDNISQASLRSAKPTWAKTRLALMEPRQRIIVFVAGGATYAESKACYDVSRASSRDVFLATSHMITPSLFLRQVGDLSVDRCRLDLPVERPPPRAPQHLFEPEPRPKAAPAPGPPTPLKNHPAPIPPTAGMHSMSLKTGDDGHSANGRTSSANPLMHAPSAESSSSSKISKVSKEKEKEDKKKKHHFFSRGK